jgi:hypothetical protein
MANATKVQIIGADGGAVDVSGGGLDVNVTAATQQATYTNRSGTITAGNSAQTIAALNAARFGYFIQNVSAGDLWFSTLATAVIGQPSIKLGSGQSVTVTSPDVTTGAISIIGATTGQAFAAREW